MTPKKMPKKKHWSSKLPDDACSEATRWARTQPTAAKAWLACERADWMLWLLAKMIKAPGDKRHKRVVLAACAVARTALRYVPKGELLPLLAIRVTERWVAGKATLDEVREARTSAYAAAADASAAAYAAHASAAAYAAHASAYAAADASAHAAYAAHASADAAHASASAYAAADASAYAASAYAAGATTDAARSKAHKRMCRIIRKAFPRAG
jgi:hypothetical protein